MRDLSKKELLTPKGKGKGKGKGRATYYVSGKSLSTPPKDLSAPPQDLSAPPQISDALKDRISRLKKREHDHGKIESIIFEICDSRFVKATHVAEILNKGEDYIKRKYLSPMIQKGKLGYLHPEMINHPDQAYQTKHSKS